MTHPSTDTLMTVFNEEIPPEPLPDISTPSMGDLFPSHMDFVPDLLFPSVDNHLMFDGIESSELCATDLDAANPAFDHNLEQIRRGLRDTFNRATKTHLSSTLNKYGDESIFDEAAVSTLLNPSHVRVLVATYFRTTVPDFPVTHEASFSFENSCPELILAIMLSGSLRCAPHDYVLAARKLMRLGVEFIFSRMLEVQHDVFNRRATRSPSLLALPPHFLPRHVIDTVAAALIADSAMATVNDTDEGCPRSRLRSERLYQLSSVVRSCGMIQARRSVRLDVDTDWQRFIQEESCIR